MMEVMELFSAYQTGNYKQSVCNASGTSHDECCNYCRCMETIPYMALLLAGLQVIDRGLYESSGD